ncbi:ATP-binding protein [Atopobium fossor]|uniref:ATP-binding protein n=1 Tax=Atopobium fossor TaxID=39487 RepID=UPI000427E53C|nr:ATP-binding protein [Atopobium fossor]
MSNEAQKHNNLFDFVETVSGDKTLRVEENLGEGFVRLRVAEAERRQAKHDIRCSEDVIVEMLRNSRDAGAQHIYVATARDRDMRSIVILDDGQGIPEYMQEKVFDARVTSKLESMHMDRWGVHGRGMALYSIKENSDEARVMSSGLGKGTSIRIVTDTTRLSERADQSTWPQIGTDDEGAQSVVRGPHNIVRTCCEFALEERPQVSVYLGSPAEIVATIRSRVRSEIDETELLFIDSLEFLPVLHRLYAAADAIDLQEVSRSLGLDISERTAHRILAHQIKPQRSVIAQLTHSTDDLGAHEVDLLKDRRGLKLSQDDLDDFSRLLERDFELIAKRYYVSLAGQPKIRVSKNRISVSFEIDKDD